MAYIKTTWADRLVERPNTFEVQENPDGTITLIPTPGTVTQAGTPVNATNLNKIEDGIATLESNVTTHLAQTENEITTHVNMSNIHQPIKVFVRQPNSGAINNGDLLFLYDNLIDWTPTKWEVGSLQSGNGELLPALHRVRTIDYISVTPGEYKSFVTGPTEGWGEERGTINYLFYTESNLFVYTTSWVINGSNISVPSNAEKMKVIVRLPEDPEGIDANLAKDTIKPVLTKVYR